MPKDALSDPITIRLPVDVLAGVEEIAETCDRTRSWVIVRALKIYMMNEGAEILAVRHGMKDVAEGRVEDFDDVLRDVERIVAGKVA